MSENRFDKLITILLPVPFLCPVYLNLFCSILWFLGYFFEIFGPMDESATPRLLLVYTVYGVSALLLLVKTYLLWRERPEKRRWILGAVCICALLGVLFLLGILRTPSLRYTLLRDAVISGGMLVAQSCALLIVILDGQVRPFLRACRLYAYALSPLILIYLIFCYTLPPTRFNVGGFGLVDYMSFGYLLFFLIVMLLLEVLLYDMDGTRARLFRRSLVLTVFFTAAIAISGAKGTMLCLLALSVLSAAAILITRARKRQLLLPLCTALAVLLFATVLYPPQHGPSRLTVFFEQLFSSSAAITQEETDTAIELTDRLHTLYDEDTPQTDAPQADAPQTDAPQTNAPQADAPQTDAFSSTSYDALTDETLSERADAALEIGALTQEEHDTLLKVNDSLRYSFTGGRQYLWSQALREIRTAPLTGQGPLFFQSKYGTYPHNLFLELATDFGVPVMLAVLALGIWVFVTLIRRGLKRPPLLAFTLYVLSYLPQQMVSGSLYGTNAFFQYGFCILLALFTARSGAAAPGDARLPTQKEDAP